MSRDHVKSAERPTGDPAAPPDGAEAPFLELLARGASADAYEQPVLLARAQGRPAEWITALEHAKLLALRVRSELEGRRRREAELSALFETAHDLAGLRDLDAVLQAIVQRARSLLGTDVAYLSLNDPERGDTYMRVTEGSVAAGFQQLRLGMGEGLGGLVAQTARPYVTDDYFQDGRFQHTDSIDAGVRDEGLVAILGVPLMLGHHVIGVLFAADRRARVFEREQIALLGSFAALAAAAIDTANLLTETRSALAGLERANEIIRDRSAVIERASDVHDRLAELVLRGGGVHDVAAAVSEVLDGTVEFTDATAAPARALEAFRTEGHAVRHEDDWIAAVAAGGELFGALVLRGHPGLDPVDQRTLERAAMVTSLLLLARRSAAEAEQRVRGELLDDLLDARDRDPRLLRDRASRLHADLDATHVVLAARLDGPRPTPTTRRTPAGACGPPRPTSPPPGTAWPPPVTAARSCCCRSTPVTRRRTWPAAPPGTWAPPSTKRSRSARRHRSRTSPPGPTRWPPPTRRGGAAWTPCACSAAPATGPPPRTSASWACCWPATGTSPVSSTGPSARWWPTTSAAAPTCCAPWRRTSPAG
ncbi:hypothetical protein GCM10020295_08870 [Streptomyces cinereospinus]